MKQFYNLKKLSKLLLKNSSKFAPLRIPNLIFTQTQPQTSKQQSFKKLAIKNCYRCFNTHSLYAKIFTPLFTHFCVASSFSSHNDSKWKIFVNLCQILLVCHPNGCHANFFSLFKNNIMQKRNKLLCLMLLSSENVFVYCILTNPRG